MAVGRVNVGGGGGKDKLAVIDGCFYGNRSGTDLAYGGGYLFVNNDYSDIVYKIDAETMEIDSSTIAVGADTISISANSRRVFIVSKGEYLKYAEIDTLQTYQKNYSYSPTYVDCDEDYVYLGVQDPYQKYGVRKLDANTLDTVANSPVMDAPLHSIAIGEDFIFTNWQTGSQEEICKLNKNTLEIVAKIPLTTKVNRMTVDGDYLFATLWTGKVMKINIATMTIVAENEAYKYGSVVFLGKYLYAGSDFPWMGIHKVDINTFEVIDSVPAIHSVSLPSDPQNIVTDGKNIFVNGEQDTSTLLYKLTNTKI